MIVWVQKLSWPQYKLNVVFDNEKYKLNVLFNNEQYKSNVLLDNEKKVHSSKEAHNLQTASQTHSEFV